MLLETPIIEEEALVETESQSQTTQLNNQVSNQNQQSTNPTGSWYSGSTFAGILVIILFVVWFLYKVGCLGHD